MGTERTIRAGPAPAEVDGIADIAGDWFLARNFCGRYSRREALHTGGLTALVGHLNGFILRDADHALAYVYFDEEPGRRSAAHLMTRDEAGIAANI